MLKHDRAVQIIAMPAVFAVMAMASMVPIYELVTGNISEDIGGVPSLWATGRELRRTSAEVSADPPNARAPLEVVRAVLF